MALFAGKKLYLREVKDPDDGTVYHVKLRKMDEGYREQRSDMLMATREDTRKKLKTLPGGKRKKRQAQQVTEYNLGTVRLSDLSYSIMEWDFKDEQGNEVPVNIEFIKQLDTVTADQIWDHIEDLNPTVFAPADEDEDDTEGYEDEADEADDNGYATPVTAQSVTFGEEGGPKESVPAS